MASSDTAHRGPVTIPAELPLPLTALFDAVAVTVFVLIGRASHEHGYAFLGVLQTLWPFVAGTAAGWSIAYVYSHVRSNEWFGHDFRPGRIVPAGLVIWVCTVAVGMVLRYLLHESVAVSFIIVATISLGIFLLGWRGMAAYVRRRRTSTADPA